MKMENPFFYFFIYELLENDHSITITEPDRSQTHSPTFKPSA